MEEREGERGRGKERSSKAIEMKGREEGKREREAVGKRGVGKRET